MAASLIRCHEVTMVRSFFSASDLAEPGSVAHMMEIGPAASMKPSPTT